MHSNSVIVLDTYRKIPSVFETERRRLNVSPYTNLRAARKIKNMLAAAELAVTALIGIGFSLCIALVITML